MDHASIRRVRGQLPLEPAHPGHRPWSLRPLPIHLLTSGSRGDVDPFLARPDIAAAAVGAVCVPVEIVPALTRTRDHPAAGVVTRNLGVLNRWTFVAALGRLALRGARAEARARLDLPAG